MWLIMTLRVDVLILISRLSLQSTYRHRLLGRHTCNTGTVRPPVHALLLLLLPFLILKRYIYSYCPCKL